MSFPHIRTRNFQRLFFTGISFFKLVLPFLAEHFSHTESFWTYNYDMQRVFELKPDLVVIEFTERSIHQLLNWDGILD